MVTYHHLLLPGHEELDAAGSADREPLYRSVAAQARSCRASVLSGFDRSRLPEHPKPLWPVLKPYEAITLAMNRAA